MQYPEGLSKEELIEEVKKLHRQNRLLEAARAPLRNKLRRLAETSQSLSQGIQTLEEELEANDSYRLREE